MRVGCASVSALPPGHEVATSVPATRLQNTVRAVQEAPVSLGFYDQVEGAALVAPPRAVPRVLSWQLFASSLPVGAAVFAVFSIVWLLPVVDLRWMADAQISATGQTTRGLLTSTDQVILFGRRNPYTLTRYHFSFHLADGSVVKGTSYRSRPLQSEDYIATKQVIVEYDPADPHKSRVQGTSAGPTGPSIFAVGAALGSLVGLVLIGRRLRRRATTLRLLRQGQPVASDQLLKYSHVDGSRIHLSDLELNRPVLCDPTRPRLALAVSRLAVQVGVDGTWQALAGWGRVWVNASLAVLFLAAGITAALGFTHVLR
jgi:hypothetical protein